MGQGVFAQRIAEQRAVTDPALECLHGMGVNDAQGYAIARPAALERFPRSSTTSLVK